VGEAGGYLFFKDLDESKYLKEVFIFFI